MNKIIEEYLKSFDNLERYVLDIAPNTKPRMTQRDRWAKRPVVEKYYKFKDNIKYEAMVKKLGDLPGFIPFVIFYLPIPKAIAKKWRPELEDAPMCKYPDIDNATKSLFDCLARQDNYIHTLGVAKRYSEHPRIELYFNKKMNKEMDAWLKDLYKKTRLEK
jgi:Holliday junction resolvase RusA-like endonuclease